MYLSARLHHAKTYLKVRNATGDDGEAFTAAMKAEKCPITEERVCLLEAIGFNWSMKKTATNADDGSGVAAVAAVEANPRAAENTAASTPAREILRNPQPHRVDLHLATKEQLLAELKLRDAEANDEKAMAWDEAKEEVIERKLVSYSESRVMADLPQTNRGEGESMVVARAAQAFNEQGIDISSGWISGQLDLPPTGIKDAESVGICSQVFVVASCQPKELEFALAYPDENDTQFLPETAQRFLLSPGDMFCVPAGNMYRIENISKTHECKLFWTIIRPASEQELEEVAPILSPRGQGSDAQT